MGDGTSGLFGFRNILGAIHLGRHGLAGLAGLAFDFVQLRTRHPQVAYFAELGRIVIAEDEARAKEQLAKAGKVYGGHMGAALAEHGIWGTPERVIECIERHRALGCSLFVIEFFGRDTREPARLFAETVLRHYRADGDGL